MLAGLTKLASLIFTTAALGATSGAARSGPVCAAGTVVYNSSGCTTAGHYAETAAATPDDCCAQCAANVTGCAGWTWHASSSATWHASSAAHGGGVGTCDLSNAPKLKHGVANAVCGCRFAGCAAAPVACTPPYRPPVAARVPLPAGIARQPHLISILVDDLGFDDTSLRGNERVSWTPAMRALQEEGIALQRHHTYLWCSPTRRSLLTGRYPVHITGLQAPQCSNLTPLQFSLLSEKLSGGGGYDCAFYGKGHLGYDTVDHLPARRGFGAAHVGYLGGGESYRWGGRYGSPEALANVTGFDMWDGESPAAPSLVEEIRYSTQFYAAAAVRLIEARNASSPPLWLHMSFQAVHGGNWRQDVPAQDALDPASVDPAHPPLDLTYASATRALDDAVANITGALRAAGMWEDTLLLLTSDNGGDCGLPDQRPSGGPAGQPGSASNYPLLGRKCTAFEGGTRVAAFVAGGVVPEARRGTSTNQSLMWVSAAAAAAAAAAAPGCCCHAHPPPPPRAPSLLRLPSLDETGTSRIGIQLSAHWRAWTRRTITSTRKRARRTA